MDILIATTNIGKFREMAEVLSELPLNFVSLNDLNMNVDVKEDGRTHEENAMLKAQAYGAFAKLPTIAEDSGIFVEAFGDELGIHTRRWGPGEHASDKEWLDAFLKRMEQIPAEKRNATFVSVAAFFHGNEIRVFRGETRGRITIKSQAALQKGIPLSSCFIPEGCDTVYSGL